jgi:Pectate lyase superfamily protein/Secretion system C-terminal sorting domain
MSANRIKYFNLFIFLFFCFKTRAQTEQIAYPKNMGWVNVQTDFGAKGDGITDDTDAIRRALTTSQFKFSSGQTLFFPKGIYLVSDSMKYLSGYYDGYITLQGEGMDRTIIKLKDNAVGFQDTAKPKPVFWTRAGNQSFNQYVANLSIVIGTGNAGAVALDYITSNNGAIENVRITALGAAWCGLSMERGWPGPGLIKNVTIEGFNYRIRLSQTEYSMVFEQISLKKQTKIGFLNIGNVAVIRKLTSENTVPALQNQNGLMILLDSELKLGKDSAAIINNDRFFARNVLSDGYASVLKNKNTYFNGKKLTEFNSSTTFSLFPNDAKSLNLPIKETPQYFNNDTTQWANVLSFGAKPTDPLYAINDITTQVQAAFNSGKAVIYFPPVSSNGSGYCIYSDVTIPSSVKKIIGIARSRLKFFNNAKLVVNQSVSDALVFEKMDGLQLQHNSNRTVVIKNSSLAKYDNAPASGEVFLEDVVGGFTPQYPTKMWARHLNSEKKDTGDINVLNNGGQFWILGLKTEGQGRIIKTTNGGASEMLGGLIYPAGTFPSKDNVAFECINSCQSMIYGGINYSTNGFYGIVMQETQGSSTKILRTSDVGGISMPFYLSSKNNCGLTPIRTFLDETTTPSVFPNPTSDFLFIKSENTVISKIELYNIVGQLIFSDFYPTDKINISNLPKGMFLVKIFTPLKSFTQKIIKQ